MNGLIRIAVNAVWNQVERGQTFRTPDLIHGSNFSIQAVDQDSIKIRTTNGSDLRINREAFSRAIFYLLEHRHNQGLPCEIRSNNDADAAGPLCQITREVNDGTRVITYILPILATYGFVALDGGQPNTVWLI